MGVVGIQSEGEMETTIRLVLSVVALTNLCQGAFTANDASSNFGGEFAQKNLNLRRQLLEEILAEIEEEELAIQRQHQQQAQQNQLRQQIQQLMVFELPQNNKLIDSLTEKMYEVALICRNKNCAGNVDFERKKVELTRVIEPSIELFIARMINLVAPETLTSSRE